MSCYLCKKILLNRKDNIIKCFIASSNISPKTYTTNEFCKGEEFQNYSFNDKLISLYESMQNGFIQISTTNDNTKAFQYAMCKVKEYMEENQINSYKDLYIKKNEKVANKLLNLDKIEKAQKEKEINLEILWQVYGETYVIWKKALEEKYIK